MKKIILILLLFCVINVDGQTYPPQNPVYQLVWGDEFDQTVVQNIVDNETRRKDADGFFVLINEPLQTKVDMTKWRHNNSGDFPFSFPYYKQKYGCFKDISNNPIEPIWSQIEEYFAYETWFYRNIEVNNGICSLLIKNEVGPQYCWDGFTGPLANETEGLFNCTKGALYSKQKFKYGYFEIKIRLPHAEVGQEDQIKGVGPDFWLWDAFKLSNCLDPDRIVVSEIDVFEILSRNNNESDYDNDYYNADWMTNEWTRNVHTGSCNLNDISYATRSIPTLPIFPNIANFTPRKALDFSNGQFHTFGTNWQPDKLQWFIDGVLVREELFVPSENYPLLTPGEYLVEMPLIIDLSFPIVKLCDPDALPNSGLNLPYLYEIDYVRVYQPTTDCNTNLSLCDPVLYEPKIYNSINMSSNCSYNATNTYNAVEGIYVNEGTTITSNSYLQINPTCDPQIVNKTLGVELTQKEIWTLLFNRSLKPRWES